MKARYIILTSIVFLTGLCLLLALFHTVDFARPASFSLTRLFSDDKAGDITINARPSPPGLTVVQPNPDNEQPQDKALTDNHDDAQADIGSVILSMPSQQETQRLADWLLQQGITSFRTIPQLNAVVLEDADNALLRAIADEFQDARLERDFTLSRPTTPSPNTVAFGRQFQNSLLDWLGIDSERQGRGKGVTIAVLDEPIFKTAATANANLRQLDINGIVSNGQNEGHGNAVTSILAAGSDELKGIVPDAAILSIPVLNNNGDGTLSALAQAIISATDNGADIISLSLGSEYPSRALQNAINYAYEHGAVIVAAAGNDGSDTPFYPAAYNHVIAVAACDAKSNAMAFSNYGSAIDIAAPGVCIAADFGNDTPELFSGTSAAAPCVAGVIAALLSDNIGKMTASEAAETILSSAYDNGAPGNDEQFGHGVLNYARAANHDNPDYTDAAAAGHFLDLDNASVADTPLLISAQNTGNTMLPTLTVEYTVNDTDYERTFENVAPGETVTATVAVPNTMLDGIMVFSRVLTPEDEARTDNNTKLSRIIVQTEEQSDQ
ncbi:MAG: S8 family serine peptidase [Victivallales bacterium]|nr:S8 family serine peptidase [Victivallales bacterium]